VKYRTLRFKTKLNRNHIEAIFFSRGTTSKQRGNGATAMWLVRHPGELHTVADEAGLHKLGQQYGIKLGNLRQLVGLDQSPRGNRRQTCDND
jgi:hypothetical protein